MSTDAFGMRPQIMANARVLLCQTGSSQYATGETAHSSATLVNNSAGNGVLEIVVFAGTADSYTAAIMVGTQAALEGGTSATPEGALRRLLIATAEVLNSFMPKVGSHQRNIHGGGVFDEDMINPALIETQRKPS